MFLITLAKFPPSHTPFSQNMKQGLMKARDALELFWASDRAHELMVRKKHKENILV